jgi:hypothetical protein
MTQTLHIAEPLFERLRRHLFPGDRDEHGAVILAGLAASARGMRLLAREVVLARDGVDYVPGRHREFSGLSISREFGNSIQAGPKPQNQPFTT